MFYFYPEETTDLESFYGGLYIGFNPNKFYINKNGKTKNTTSKLLGEEIEWTIFEYEDEVFIQTITSIKGKDGWKIMIHAFGTAQKNEDLEKFLLVLGTLDEKTNF